MVSGESGTSCDHARIGLELILIGTKFTAKRLARPPQFPGCAASALLVGRGLRGRGSPGIGSMTSRAASTAAASAPTRLSDAGVGQGGPRHAVAEPAKAMTSPSRRL